MILRLRVRCKVGPQFPTWRHCASFSLSPSDQHRKWSQVKPIERRALELGAMQPLQWAAHTEVPEKARVPWGGVVGKTSGTTSRSPMSFLCSGKCGPTDPSGTSFLVALESGEAPVGVNELPCGVAAPHLLFLLGHSRRLLRLGSGLGFLPHTCALTYKVLTQSVT